MIMKNKLAIYVSSFDGCNDLWETFFTIFDRFWGNCAFPIYLINNELKYEHKNVKVINSGPEVNWFDRTLRTLESLEEEYIFFFLEDYFISKSVKNEEVDEIIDLMSNNNIYYYRISSVPSLKSKQLRLNNSGNMKYPICLQPAIWNRIALIEILKEINAKSPWDFEYYYTSRYGLNPKKLDGVMYDTRDILGYKNGVLRGKWIPQTLSYYKKLGLNINTGERDILPFFKAKKYQIADWISNHITEKNKMSIKKLLKVFKFDYLH